jgi:hypothetical protein
MMPDRKARQERIERRLEQSKRLLKGANDPRTTDRFGKLIECLEQEQVKEREK